MRPADTAALAMWWRAVVLTGDTVQGLHVDGVGRPGRGLQFGPTGDAAGHGFHLLGHLLADIVLAPADNPLPIAGPSIRWQCHPMDWVVTISYHFSPAHLNGRHCNGLEWAALLSMAMHWSPARLRRSATPAESGSEALRSGWHGISGMATTSRRPENDAITARLRTVVRRAIITVIAHLLPAEITPKSRPPRSSMTTVAGVNDGLEMSRFYGLKLSHLVIVQRFGQSA